MFNTYDVQFYASYAISMNWPLIQLSLQYDMREAIFTEIKEKQVSLYDGVSHERKKLNTVPHDIGDPCKYLFTYSNVINITIKREVRYFMQ